MTISLTAAMRKVAKDEGLSLSTIRRSYMRAQKNRERLRQLGVSDEVINMTNFLEIARQEGWEEEYLCEEEKYWSETGQFRTVAQRQSQRQARIKS